MNFYKSISLFLFLFTILSCSSEDDSNPTPESQTYNFSIEKSSNSIMELDSVEFILANPNNANIADINWYLNDEALNVDFTTYFEHTFHSFGTYSLKAVVDYINSNNEVEQKIVTINFTVTERPKYLVQIKKVEILAYSGMGEYYVNGLGYYMKTKFNISELDDLGSQTIKLISSENSQNWGGNYSFPVTWDISNENYYTTVYKEGNYYPHNQENYNSRFSFFAAKRLNSGNTGPYTGFNGFALNLNPYREIQPQTVDFNNLGLEIRLTLEWN